MIDPAKLLDLTWGFDPQTIYWPTDSGFEYTYDEHGITPEGYFYAAGHFTSPDHGGTHMDAPLHFNRGGLSAGDVEPGSLIGPAAVIDFSARAREDPDAMLSPSDIAHYERNYGPIPSGAIVVARCGWGRFWPDSVRYLGTGRRGGAAALRFPGFSPEAVRFLLAQRAVTAIAIDTASLDPGNSRDYPVHRLWLGANRAGFENLANAERLPPAGATLICAPMKIAGATGAPARIFALLP